MGDSPNALNLRQLVSQSRLDHACSFGHQWKSQGGRECPRFENMSECSQPVYRCARCGDYDYGEPGGPGHQNCYSECTAARDSRTLNEDE